MNAPVKAVLVTVCCFVIAELLHLAIGYVTNRVRRPPENYIAATNAYTTNVYDIEFADNGLGAWLADTNHTTGPLLAKSIYVVKLRDGKYYIRWLEFGSTNADMKPFFAKDIAYKSADDARQALQMNIDIRTKKTVNDAIEDAFRK